MSTRRPLLAATARAAVATAAVAAAAAGFTAGRHVGRRPLDAAERHSVAAQAEPGPVYAVPVLDKLGDDDVCESWLAVQNVGGEATQGVLVVLGGAAPGTAGDPLHSFPIGVMCTGLIQPGSSWHLVGALIPDGVDPNAPPTPGGGSFTARQRTTPARVGRRAALVFSVAPDRLADILDDPDGAAEDDIAANRLCELLHDHARASSAAWSEFLAAWWSGGPWHGLPLGAVAGAPLRVQVHRTCPGPETPGVDATGGYDAPLVPAAGAGAWRSVVGGLHSVRTGRGRVSVLYVQNVGRHRAAVSVRFQAQGACAPDPSTKTFSLQPGDAGYVEIGDAVDDGWHGSAMVEADQPVVVAAEDVHGDSIRLDVAPAAAVGTPEPAGPRYASVLLAQDAHTVSAHVVNAGTMTVQPRMTIYDAEGDLERSPVEGAPLCPGGSTTLSLPVTPSDPAGGAYLVTVDAVGDGASAAQLPATIEVARPSPLLGAGALQAYTVAARTIPAAADVAGIAPLAVPAAMHALETFGRDVELSISLAGDVAGVLDYAVLAYDHNGLVGGACRTIATGHSDVLSIADLPGLPTNMLGAALIVATAWHPAPDALGPPGGLVASVLTRHGTFAGEEAPGDEIAAALALPVEGGTAAIVPGPPCAPVVEPPPVAASEDALAQAVLFAPTVSYAGLDNVCLAAVRVTNRSSAPSQFVALTFYEPGFLDPECSGPLDAVCTPQIAPGASWDFLDPDVGGSASAVIVGMKGSSLDALGLVPGESRSAADVLCEEGTLMGECAAWRRFALALRTGGPVHGLRLADVAAPISAVVARSCDNVADVRVKDVANYAAVPLADVVRGRTRPERYVYTVARALGSVADPADPVDPNKPREGVIYLQNAGERSVSIGLTYHGDDGTVTGCSVFALASGETYAHYVTDCLSEPWVGWLSIAADGPLAVMTDVEIDPVTSRAATAGGDRCDVNADGAVDAMDVRSVYTARNSAPGGGRWNPRADLDLSGHVDTVDVEVVAACIAPIPRPTDILLLRPTDPTPTLWSPLETPGADGTPGPDPTATTDGRSGAIYLPYGASNRRR